MGLYEEAVDHALSVDLTLAMRNADAAVDDEDLRKKLWLRIAKHVVMEEKNIDKAMQARYPITFTQGFFRSNVVMLVFRSCSATTC